MAPATDCSTATESVVRQLEEEVASIPRKSSFRFPPEQVRFITYMMSKYGEDYKVPLSNSIKQETLKMWLIVSKGCPKRLASKLIAPVLKTVKICGILITFALIWCIIAFCRSKIEGDIKQNVEM